MKEAFALVDLEGNGFITAKDLADLAAVTGEAIPLDQLSDMIRTIDSDHDGRVDFKVFVPNRRSLLQC
jgi:calcium-binding protein CML